MPAPIAFALQAWESESVLFRRQARLLACFEALVQYAAIVAVSEFHRAGLDREFPDVDGLIREVIHRPSTGTWQRIYREAAGAFRTRRAALVTDSLYRFGFDDAGRQQPWMRGADLITQLRNEQKGHGHVLEDEAEYRAILARHDAFLRELLEAAQFARELTLCVVLERGARGIVAGRLMGSVETAGPRDEFPPADDAPPPGRVAVRHSGNGRWVDLSPLLLYVECERDVERIDGQGNRTRQRCGKPGVFFHHELIPPSRVRGFEFRYAHHSSWRFPDFDFVARYLERYARRPGGAVPAEWYSARIAEAQRFFVGREEPLRQLTRLVDSGPRRVAFVRGGPGFGKSTLLARWISRQEPEGAEPRVHVCRHFVQEQYPESGRASTVFDVLRLQLCARFGLDPTPPYPDGRARADRYRTALLETLMVAVDRSAGKPIALVIDGLDEALRVTAGEDESLIEWLPGPGLLPAGVSLILSGRPNVADLPVFQARFGRDVAEYVELASLEDADVREWFELAFGPVYALEHHAFLERVAETAQGHPQYLHFAQRALMDGSLQPGDLEQLPAGLEDFYRRVMHDAAGEQPAALRVIALLAAAASPLDLGTLAAVLENSTDETAKACDAARNVLAWDADGQVLLFDVEFSKWVRAGQVQSPADALRRDTYAALSARLLEWCRGWATHANPYAASNLVAHLVAAGKHDEVAALTRNPAFLRFQATARPDTPDLPQATFRAALHQALQSGDHAGAAEFGLRRVSWATATLAESPVDAFRKGSLERARRLADLHDPGHRLAWYFLLAVEILKRDGPANAEAFLGLPGRLPWWSASVRLAAEDAGSLADSLVPLRDLPGFDTLWRLYLDEPARGRLARDLASMGSIDLAERIVTATPASQHRDPALIALAEKAAAAGDFERAYRFTEGMWRGDSRWTIRGFIASLAASAHGLAVLETAEREASRNPVVRDALVRRIAVAFAGAGRFEEAAVATSRIEGRAERDAGRQAIAREAIAQGRIGTATRFIAGITHGAAPVRSLLDRAGLAALRSGRLAELAGVFAGDPAAKRIAACLAGLTAAVAVGMTVLAAASVPMATWGLAAWLVLALAITIGLRTGQWRAGFSALLWGGLTAWSLAGLSDAGPLPVTGAMVGGGIALLAAATWFGLDRLASRFAARAVLVLVTGVVVAGILTTFAGSRLVAWSQGSPWLVFALLLPAGTAFATAAVASTASVEERLGYHSAGLPLALVLFLAGWNAAGGLPLLLLSGWLLAAIAWFISGRLPGALGIPGRAALFFAMAEAVRALFVLTELESVGREQDPISTLFSIAIVIVGVAVIRRTQDQPPPTEESPTSGQAPPRARRALADLVHRPGEHVARFRAEMLLRLARLFPRQGGSVARAVARDAATAAAALSPDPPQTGPLEEPVRRDLLWQIARESWRHRDYAGAARAAWLVEWRGWSGLLAAAGAVATGAALGVMIRWVIPLQFPGMPRSVEWASMTAGALLAVLSATPRLRTLREPLVALPLSLLTAAWITRGTAGPALATPLVRVLLLFLPVVLVLLLLMAVGAPRSGRAFGWLAALLQVWRRQVLLAAPGASLAAGIAALIMGRSLAVAVDVSWRPVVVLVFLTVTLIADDAVTRAAKRLLPTRALDLPPPPGATGQDDAAVLERGAFAEDVGAVVVRLAEREPAALSGIARAALSVR